MLVDLINCPLELHILIKKIRYKFTAQIVCDSINQGQHSVYCNLHWRLNHLLRTLTYIYIVCYHFLRKL